MMMKMMMWKRMRKKKRKKKYRKEGGRCSFCYECIFLHRCERHGDKSVRQRDREREREREREETDRLVDCWIRPTTKITTRRRSTEDLFGMIASFCTDVSGTTTNLSGQEKRERNKPIDWVIDQHHKNKNKNITNNNRQSAQHFPLLPLSYQHEPSHVARHSCNLPRSQLQSQVIKYSTWKVTQSGMRRTIMMMIERGKQE